MIEKIDTQKTGRKVPSKQVAAYGFMTGSANIVGVAKNLYLFVYITDEFGLQLELFILANLLFFAYNALNDVLFGIYADRTRHKLGRRIPYIRYGSLFIVVTNMLIWFPWPGTYFGVPDAGVINKFIQYLVYLFAMDTVMTIINVSINAWLPEATESEEERTKMSLINKMSILIGGLFVLIVPMIYNEGGLDVFRVFLLIGNTINALCLFVGSFIIKERPELYKTSFKDISTKEIFKQFASLYKKNAFLSSIIFGFATATMVMLLNNYPKQLGYGLGLENGELWVQAIFYISHYGMLPVLSLMVKSKPVDKVIVNIIKYGLVLSVVLFSMSIILNNPLILWPFVGVAGAMATVGLYGPLIGGNAIDQDELDTGERREALYGGAGALITIPTAQIVGSLVAGGLILINYQEGVGFAQADSVFAGIRFLFFIIIFISGILTLIAIKIYPFKGDALVTLKKDLIELHKKKEASATPNQESFPKS